MQDTLFYLFYNLQRKKPTSCGQTWSYDCNGLANNTKRNEVFKWLKDKCTFDIICLQETHSVQKDETKWIREWGGHIFFSHGSSNKRGGISPH